MPPISPPSPTRSLATRPSAAPPASGGVTVDPRKLLFQYWPWLVASLGCGLVLGFIVHFALRYSHPLYDGKVVFEMLPALESATQNNTTVSQLGEAEMKRFVGTQVQIMVSDTVRERAVNEPKVKSDTRWIREFTSNGAVDIKKAAKELGDIAYARQVPESNWVLLNVRTTSPQDSATIANAIKDVYLSNLRTSNVKSNQELLEAMNNRLTANNEERRLIEDQKERLIGSGSGGGGGGLETLEERFNYYAQQIEKQLPVLVGAQYNKTIQEEQLKQYTEQLEAPGGPTYPERVRSEVDQSQVILSLQRDLVALKAAERSLREKMGPNNTRVRDMHAQVESYNATVEEEKEKLLRETFNKLIDQTRSEIRSYDATILDTTKALDEARLGQADATKKKEKYDTLQEDSKNRADESRELASRIAEQNAIIRRSASNRVRVFADAEPPDRPAFPDMVVMVPLVTALTMLLTAGFIILREAMEQRVRGPSDIGAIPRVRVLGVIPDLSEDPSRPTTIETAVRDRPSGVVAECVRQIRTDILKWLSRHESATLLVVSGIPGSGATSTIVNLALSCSACERRVLIIDANLRRPRMHVLFDLAESPGLGDVLNGTKKLEEAIRSGGRPGLDVLTAGAADARSFERLTTEAMGRVLAEAKARYDLVLIDAAPTIVSSDALQLAHRCDAVALVVRAFGEKRGLVARIRSQLEETKAEFLGVIINAVRSSAGGYFRRNFRATHEYHNNNGLFQEEAPKPKRSRRKRLFADAKDEQPAPEINGEVVMPAPAEDEAPPAAP